MSGVVATRDVSQAKGECSLDCLQYVTTAPYLIIHILRFHFQGVRGEKLRTEMAIPSTFAMSSKRYETTGGRSRTRDVSRREAVIVHEGVMPGAGHYVADCKIGDQWVRLNDATDKVRRFSAKAVVT